MSAYNIVVRRHLRCTVKVAVLVAMPALLVTVHSYWPAWFWLAREIVRSFPLDTTPLGRGWFPRRLQVTVG